MLIQRIGELVLAAAYICLSSGYIIGCAFASCKTIHGYSYIATGQCSLIVDLAVACTGQGYLSLRNFKSTICYNKLNIGVVFAGILEIAIAQTHVVSSGIGLVQCTVSTEGEIIHCILRIADRYIITGNGYCLAIIKLAVTMTGNGYDNLFFICGYS